MSTKKIFEGIFDNIGEAIRQAERPAHWNRSHTEERTNKLNSLTTLIIGYAPDGGEAAELIAAVAAGLKYRYDDCNEALLYLSMAKLALERLDIGYQVDAKEELEALESLSRRAEKRVP